MWPIRSAAASSMSDRRQCACDLRCADGRNRLATRHAGPRDSVDRARMRSIGGLVGAGIAKAGLDAIVWHGRRQDSCCDCLLAGVGFLLALVHDACVVVDLCTVDAAMPLTVFSAACNSYLRRFTALGHGGNDAQKTMGIIAVLLYSQGHLGRRVSTFRSGWSLPARSRWRLGTLVGGWRIVKTMGSKHHAADTDAGLLRRNRRFGDAVCGDLARHSGIDDAYDYRIDHRGRRSHKMSAVRWSVARKSSSPGSSRSRRLRPSPRCFIG